MSLMLGITALVLLLFYLVGCFLNLWQYNIIDLVFNPIAGSIILTAPIFSGIIIMRFLNYNKTRNLFCNIVKTHRDKINFFLQNDDRGNPDNEIRYVLWGNYKDSSFRFSYTMGHPMVISLIGNKDEDIILLNKRLQKNKLKGLHFNCYGLTLEIKKPLLDTELKNIPAKLDLLIKNYRVLSDKTPQEV